MAGGADAAAVPVGIPLAGARRAHAAGAGQARQRRRAAGAEGGRGRARCEAGRGRRAVRAAHCLRPAAAFHHAVRGAARRRLRARHPARDPAPRALGVPPPAYAVPALPSRAPDRRRLARYRARHQRRLHAAVVHAVLDRPGDPRVRPGGRGAAGEIRLALRRRHLRRGRALHRLHLRRLGVAHRHPPARQRARLARQHARHRQPAQLRDGQVLQQRGVRGGPLRRKPEELRGGRGEERGLARPAQHRAEPDHRDRGDAADDTRGGGRGRRLAHARRPGADQRPADPALHSAQLPRHGLPRDQAGADRHGPHVPPARAEPRDRGPPGRCAAAGRRRDDPLRPR